ncbi:HPP family protein [Streptomyces sp. 7R007]
MPIDATTARLHRQSDFQEAMVRIGDFPSRAAAGPGGSVPDGSPGVRQKVVRGLRLFLLSAVLLAGVGAIGRLIGWTALTTTLGPTAYLLLAHPESVSARARSAVTGHVLAVAVGLGCLAAFGLWSHPSVAEQHHDTFPQIGAQALAVGVTLFLLHLCNAHHPPAAATALLITSGICRPGPPLYGLLVGLALVLAIAPVLTAAAALTQRRQ